MAKLCATVGPNALQLHGFLIHSPGNSLQTRCLLLALSLAPLRGCRLLSRIPSECDFTPFLPQSPTGDSPVPQSGAPRAIRGAIIGAIIGAICWYGRFFFPARLWPCFSEGRHALCHRCRRLQERLPSIQRNSFSGPTKAPTRITASRYMSSLGCK